MSIARIGDLLVEHSVITKEKLEEALEIQKTSNKLIGIILIELGYVDQKTLEKYLLMQSKFTRR
jgi:type IV pilus assembly protein PilB